MVFLFEEWDKGFGKGWDVIEGGEDVGWGVDDFGEMNLGVVFFELGEKGLKV